MKLIKWRKTGHEAANVGKCSSIKKNLTWRVLFKIKEIFLFGEDFGTYQLRMRISDAVETLNEIEI